MIFSFAITGVSAQKIEWKYSTPNNYWETEKNIKWSDTPENSSEIIPISEVGIAAESTSRSGRLPLSFGYRFSVSFISSAAFIFFSFTSLLFCNSFTFLHFNLEFCIILRVSDQLCDNAASDSGAMTC